MRDSGVRASSGGLRPQDVAVFLVVAAFALVLEWTANDLIWSAWFALVCGAAAVSLVLVILEAIHPVPGTRRLGIGGAVLALVLLATFIVLPLASLAHALQQLHPEPDRVPDLRFFPYIAASLRYAAAHYWPMAAVVAIEQAWDAAAARGSPERRGDPLIGWLAEIVRLSLLAFPLVFLHVLGLPRAMVVVALAVLLIPVSRIRGWLGLD